MAYKRISRGQVLGISLLGGTGSVWAEDDHFLYVRGSGYHEEYFRFFWRDIQQISFQKNLEGTISYIFTCTVLLVFLLAFITFVVLLVYDKIYWGAVGVFVLWVLLAVRAYFVVKQGARGRIVIRTVNSQHIVPMGTKKLFRQLVDCVEQVQGSLGADSNVDDETRERSDG